MPEPLIPNETAQSEPQQDAVPPAPKPLTPAAAAAHSSALQTDVSAPAPGPSIQRGPTRDLPEQAQIPTEIGPLPADLWALIGQPAPETDPHVSDSPLAPSAEPEQPKKEVSESSGATPTSPAIPSIQRQPQEAVRTPADAPTGEQGLTSTNSTESIQTAAQEESVISPDLTARTTPPESESLTEVPTGPAIQRPQDPTAPAAFIQRAAVDTPASDAGSESDDAAAETLEGSDESQIDVEDLARQVYDRVRGLLKFDRERNRRSR